MERIVLHTSPRYIYRRIAGALAVGLGAGTALLRLHLPGGWIVLALCGVYALFQLRSLGEDTERVVIDDSGIRDSMLPVGVIGWAEVRGASVQKVGSVEVVALQLRDPERFIRQLPTTRQSIARYAHKAGLPGVYLTLVGTDGDPRKIAEDQEESRKSRVESLGFHRSWIDQDVGEVINLAARSERDHLPAKPTSLGFSLLLPETSARTEVSNGKEDERRKDEQSEEDGFGYPGWKRPGEESQARP